MQISLDIELSFQLGNELIKQAVNNSSDKILYCFNDMYVQKKLEKHVYHSTLQT